MSYGKDELKMSGKEAGHHLLMFAKHASEAAVGGSKMAYTSVRNNEKLQKFVKESREKIVDFPKNHEAQKPSAKDMDMNLRRVDEPSEK